MEKKLNCKRTCKRNYIYDRKKEDVNSYKIEAEFVKKELTK